MPEARSRADGSGAAFLRFHLKVGARVGSRLLAPVLAGAFAVYYLLRPELVLLLADHLFFRGDALRRGIALSVVTGLIGAAVAPRVTFGLGGWIRHLPSAGRAHRLQAALAVWIAEAPLLLPLAGLAFLVPAGKNGPGAAWSAAAGLVASGVFMALYLLPVRQPLWASGLSLAAVLLGGTGHPAGLLAAAGAAYAADRATGPFLGRGRAVRRFLKPPAGPTAFALRLNLRAGGAALLWAFAPPAFFQAWAFLLLRNNPLGGQAVRAAVRLAACGGAAGSVILAAAILAKRRPPWPWHRSLPLGSRARILEDALFLAAPAAACLLLAALRTPSALAAAAFLPYAALRAAGALRPSMETPRSPIPGRALELFLVAAASSLVPLSLVLLPAAAVAAGLDAARRERAVQTGRWLERRFSAAGDPLTWSSR